MTRHRTAAVGLVAALVLPLAGCGVLPGGDPTTPAPDPGRQLTEQEARDALPEVPATDEARPEGAEPHDLEADPPECLDVLRAGEAADELTSTRVVRESRGWLSSSPPDSDMTVTIASYSSPVDPAILDRAGAALSSCESFDYRGVDADGTSFDLDMYAEPRTVEPIGDQTFADRITMKQKIDGVRTTVYIDQLVMRIGHTLVTVSQIHFDVELSTRKLEKYAAEVLESLST